MQNLWVQKKNVNWHLNTEYINYIGGDQHIDLNVKVNTGLKQNIAMTGMNWFYQRVMMCAHALRRYALYRHQMYMRKHAVTEWHKDIYF